MVPSRGWCEEQRKQRRVQELLRGASKPSASSLGYPATAQLLSCAISHDLPGMSVEAVFVADNLRATHKLLKERVACSGSACFQALCTKLGHRVKGDRDDTGRWIGRYELLAQRRVEWEEDYLYSSADHNIGSGTFCLCCSMCKPT